MPADPPCHGPSHQTALILGSPRSGTTFLLRALSAAPATEGVAVGVLPAPVFSVVAAGLAADARGPLELALRSALDQHVAGARRSRSGAAARWLQRDISTPELIRGLRRDLPISTLVYKEPFLSLCPDYATAALGAVRLVVLHRDGRDVADSLVRTYDVLTDDKLRGLDTNEAPIGRRAGERFVPWWVEDDDDDEFLAATPYLRSVWLWRAMVRRMLDFAGDAEASGGRLATVHYEALVRRPRDEGHRILDFLGLEGNRRVRRRLAQASPRSIGVHRSRDPGEIRAATDLARAELTALGYA